MAQLKDLTVTGQSRFIGDVYADKIQGYAKTTDVESALSGKANKNGNSSEDFNANAMNVFSVSASSNISGVYISGTSVGGDTVQLHNSTNQALTDFVPGGQNADITITAPTTNGKLALVPEIIRATGADITISDFSKEYRIISQNVSYNELLLNFNSVNDVPDGYTLEVIGGKGTYIYTQCSLSGSESVFLDKGDIDTGKDFYECLAGITKFVFVKDTSASAGFYWFVYAY